MTHLKSLLGMLDATFHICLRTATCQYAVITDSCLQVICIALTLTSQFWTCHLSILDKTYIDLKCFGTTDLLQLVLGTTVYYFNSVLYDQKDGQSYAHILCRQ